MAAPPCVILRVLFKDEPFVYRWPLKKKLTELTFDKITKKIDKVCGNRITEGITLKWNNGKDNLSILSRKDLKYVLDTVAGDETRNNSMELLVMPETNENTVGLIKVGKHQSTKKADEPS